MLVTTQIIAFQALLPTARRKGPPKGGGPAPSGSRRVLRKQESRRTSRRGLLGLGLGLGWGSGRQTNKGISLVLPSWSHCSFEANLTPALHHRELFSERTRAEVGTMWATMISSWSQKSPKLNCALAFPVPEYVERSPQALNKNRPFYALEGFGWLPETMACPQGPQWLIGAVAWKTYASCPCQDAILCLRSSEIWQVRSGQGLRQSRVSLFPGFLRSDRAPGEDSCVS